jgi:uncharacterized membrane protein
MRTSDPDVAATINSDIVRQPTARKPERLLSIDLLRGLTIAFMILVNDQTGPAPFSQLVHARWNGFTATDLVFPTSSCWSVCRPCSPRLPGWRAA